MNAPHVLVLMACYNGERFLRQQLASIEAQVGVNVHILISVDPSTDYTSELVESAVDRGVASQLTNDSAAGGAARNFYRLIRSGDAVGYDFVALADQDDIWLPAKLLRAIEELERTGASAYSSNVLAWRTDDPFEKATLVDKAQPQQAWDFLFSSAGPGCTYVFRVPEFMEFAAWLRANAAVADAVDYHDWLIYAWYRARGLRWTIDAEPSMYYRQHGANQIGANRGIRAVVDRFKDLHNGWFEKQAILISSLTGQDEEPPIVALRSGLRRKRLKLVLMAPKLRRSRFDSLVVATLGVRSGRRLP